MSWRGSTMSTSPRSRVTAGRPKRRVTSARLIFSGPGVPMTMAKWVPVVEDEEVAVGDCLEGAQQDLQLVVGRVVGVGHAARRQPGEGEPGTGDAVGGQAGLQSARGTWRRGWRSACTADVGGVGGDDVVAPLCQPQVIAGVVDHQPEAGPAQHARIQRLPKRPALAGTSGSISTASTCTSWVSMDQEVPPLPSYTRSGRGRGARREQQRQVASSLEFTCADGWA